MSVNIYLIRHGEVEPPKGPNNEPLIYGPDQPLSILGEMQMGYLAESLQSQLPRISVVYTSPAARAVRSARILASGFNVPLIQYSELRPVKYSTLEGWPQAIIEKPEDLFIDESVETADERANRAFKRIISDLMEAEEMGAIVTHEEQIGLIMGRLRKPDSSVPVLDSGIGNGEAIHLVVGPGYVLESKAMVPLGIPRRGIER